jgi:peptide chain release factor
MTDLLHITSGRGPDECCWVVAQVVNAIINDAQLNGFKSYIVECEAGSKADIFKSVLVAVEGAESSAFSSQWLGTIQWIGTSMFRPKHKRKNWFVGVTSASLIKEDVFDMKDLKVECFRASGPGGQHVNKTASAIRITHIPTGVSAVAQEERSQHLNRKLALSRLHEKLEEKKRDVKHGQQQDRWESHNSLERGNSIRIYEGVKFKLKRTVKVQNT